MTERRKILDLFDEQSDYVNEKVSHGIETYRKGDGKVQVIDKNGNFVPDGAVDIEITVSGAGSLAGVCSGDPTSHERENVNYIRTFSGSALVIIRSGAHPGSIMVDVNGKNIQGNRVILQSCQFV